MAVGQQVLRGTLDVPALLAVEERLERHAVDAGRVHAATLRDVLELHTHHVAAGLELSTVPQVALLVRCSEWRASRLLNEALLLAVLPQAMQALEWGLLTPEQSGTVVAQLSPLQPPVQLAVWQRLLARLTGAALPPARLTELLRRWVIEADTAAAEGRRRAAEQDRRVEYRRREDGLVDLFAHGLRGPEAQAILSRISDRSAPFGPDDERTADQRRFDAFRDLLMGRNPLPPDHVCADAACSPHDRAGCGCRSGEAAPCGADVQVHVTLNAALGTTDEPAEVAGHGPIEPDQLQDLLLNAARLTPVFIDGSGVPVAVGRTLPAPERGDPAALREALLRLAEQRPPEVLHPQHAHDHPPGATTPVKERVAVAPVSLTARARPRPPLLPNALLPNALLPNAHPANKPGAYRVAGKLRRLLLARAPRCEFPGCGARAVRCDMEHDIAWPVGPSCACNLGPCCRRHHRVKQQGWTKMRGEGSAVDWTSPTGRAWSSTPQHQPPAPPLRELPHLSGADPLSELSPRQLEEELWWLAECPDDLGSLELRAVDRETAEHDRARQRLEDGDTRWGLDLQNPYAWY
jgi:hypothetical protein